MKKSFRRITAAISFGFGLALTVPLAAQAQTLPKSITIATEGAYEPWNAVGPDGQPKGFEVDLAYDLCKRMQVECKVITQAWDGLIPSLVAGKYDVIMAAMFITPKRLETINFSTPYAIDPSAFAVAKTSPLAKSGLTGKVNLNDEAAAQAVIAKMKPLFKGVTIGVQAGTAHQAFIKQNFSEVTDIREYKTTEQHDLDLAAGRVDAIFAQETSLAATLAKPEFKDYTVAGPGFVGGVFGQGTGAGVRKEDTALLAALNKAIAEAIADGTIKKLSMQWFHTDVTP